MHANKLKKIKQKDDKLVNAIGKKESFEYIKAVMRQTFKSMSFYSFSLNLWLWVSIFSNITFVNTKKKLHL